MPATCFCSHSAKQELFVSSLCVNLWYICVINPSQVWPLHQPVTLAAQEAMRVEELSPGTVASAVGSGSIPSPQSEAVTSEMQELSLQSIPKLLPLKERKNGEHTINVYSNMQIENHKQVTNLAFALKR